MDFASTDSPIILRAMLIALPTCANLPDWEVDDASLYTALTKRSISFEKPIWDDASVEWSRYDACVIRTTWDYQEKREGFVAWADRVATVTRLFNPPAIVRWNTHKSYLRELETRGVPIVPTVWLEHGTTVDLQDVLAERNWSKGFIKPAVGATARETLRFGMDATGIAEAEAHVNRLLPNESLLLQPYLGTVETRGEHSGIFFDGEFSHAVEKIPVSGDYRVQDDFGASDAPTELDADQMDVAQRCLAAIAVPGGANHGVPPLYARVDFLTDDDGQPRVNELELVEPSLFFRHAPKAGDTLADAICRRLNGG